MNVIVLGQRQTGKTCFLVSMVGLEYLNKTEFSVRPDHSGDAANLLDMWENMLTEEGTARRPQSNDDSHTYRLKLCYGDRKICDLGWFDYRGKSIGTDDDIDNDLLRRVSDADAIFLFVPAEILKERITDDALSLQRALLRSGLKRARLHLDKYAERALTSGRRMPVAIVVTKWDLLLQQAGGQGEPELIRPREDIKSDLIALLPSLFSENNKHFETIIVPVSMGENLGKDMESKNGIINPINIHLPMVFCAYKYVSMMNINFSLKKTAKDIEAEEWSNKRGGMSILGTLADDLFNGSRTWLSYDSSYKQARNEAWNAMIDHEKGKEMEALLKTLVGEIEIYWAGNPHTLK